MRKWIRKSYRNKLYFAFVTVWLLPILLLTVFDYLYVYNTTVADIDRYTKSNLKIAAQMIDSDLATFGGIVNSIATNEDVADIIGRDQQGSRKDFSETQRLYSVTQIAMAGLPQNVPIHIVNRYRSSRYSTTNYFLPIYNDSRGDLYEAMENKLTTGKLASKIHWRIEIDGQQEDISYALGRVILDPEEGDIVGYVILDIFNSYFQNVFQMVAAYPGANILAVDSLNQVIADMENRYYPGYQFESGGNMNILDESGVFELAYDGADYKVYFESADISRLKVIEIIPKDYFYKTTLDNVKTHMLLFGLLIVLGAGVILYAAGQMVTPIKTLESAMKQVEAEDYSVRVNLPGEDEIAHLGSAFNGMTAHIQHLIEENYNKQLLIRQAEIKALKAQTNPHFLYNCLNSIHMMAVVDEKESVLKMTQALSRYYRNRVDTDTETVTLEEELGQVLNYLEIQSLRYRDKLAVETDIDDSLRDTPVLKLILQPLVENAVIHGIEQKVGRGRIILRVKKADGRLLIAVLDDGNGPGSSKHTGEKTGLLNTEMRLRYHYGDDFHFDVTRRDGFTAAELNLPLTPMEVADG